MIMKDTELKEYNIYSGLGGSFGGAEYYSTILARSLDEALSYAYECARADYDMYEGNKGIKSWFDIAFEMGFNPDEGDLSDEEQEEVSDAYNEEVESWIEYDAIPTSEDNIPEEDIVREHDLR